MEIKAGFVRLVTVDENVNIVTRNQSSRTARILLNARVCVC